MALADEVVSRISDAKLVNLTRPDTTGSGQSVDLVLLGKAVDDVVGDFATEASLTYDNDEKQHVAIAVQGVVDYLRSYALSGELDLTNFHSRLNNLRKVTTNKRFKPRSSSNKIVAVDQERLRDFDLNEEFDEIIPDRLD